MTHGFSPLPDANQNFWQLASIQVATIGLPGALGGAQVAKNFGASTACITVLIGNLILWLIALVIILMSAQKRKNAIENVSSYISQGGAFLASCILAIAFLIWYPINLIYVEHSIKTA
ncbi:MAG: hypothetical protein JSR80_04960 [Verrucomicrobia bacterium]|nr:hypothetical protein [Verrucomicrobiota bacterium]